MPLQAVAGADNDPLLRDLNPAQRQAVCCDDPHLLVLAGAGTGKTRVLTHRIAWFLRERLAPRSGIMAVTFTNKAANEMRERLWQLEAAPGGGPIQAGTFHSMARRQLVQHGEAVGIAPDFSIIDADDQKRLVRQLMREAGVNEQHFPALEFVTWLNWHKERGLRADNAEEHTVYQELYQIYEQHCRRNNLVDFGELLLGACEMLAGHPRVRDFYRQRYSCLLVDEFQDINSIQYRWMQQMVGESTRTTAVGDDDQAIYSWRGARAENMQQYRAEYGARVVRLERNYRSTENILTAANSVILNNQQRLGKTLSGCRGDGEKICIYSAWNEQNEARFVANIAASWTAEGRRLSEIAVLYRSNTQSRILEQEMLRARLNYHVYGGTRFYSRAEIKDALAYLRLLHNPHDDLAFRRAIAVPRRGIGERTLSRLQELDPGRSLWQNCAEFCGQGLSKSKGLAQFRGLIEQLRRECADRPLDEILSRTLEASGLLEMYRKIRDESGLNRDENLQELLRAAAEFEKRVQDGQGLADPEEDSSVLELFLAQAALDAGDQQSPSTDCINLMTLHAAKGLEFPLVFMVGMEMDLFPHIKSVHNQGLEEERRLCYVGMTRAQEKLYMSWSSSRYTRGSLSSRRASNFLGELPPDLVEYLGSNTPGMDCEAPGVEDKPSNGSAAAPAPSRSAAADALPWGIGEKISHKTFGKGIILDLQGKAENRRIKIRFADHGVKWLVLSHANLSSHSGPARE